MTSVSVSSKLDRCGITATTERSRQSQDSYGNTGREGFPFSARQARSFRTNLRIPHADVHSDTSAHEVLKNVPRTVPFSFSSFFHHVRYEKDGFSTGGGGGSADFAFMLLFGNVVTVAIMLLLFFRPAMVLTSIMIYYISYVWSRKNPNTSVSIWGVLISTPYVPWVMLVLDWITKNDLFHPLMGIAVGHLYYFLVDVLPDLHGIDLLKTPAFLVRLLGWGSEGSGVYVSAQGTGVPRPGRDQPGGGNPRSGPRSWGAGRPLGSS